MSDATTTVTYTNLNLEVSLSLFQALIPPVPARLDISLTALGRERTMFHSFFGSNEVEES